MNLVFQGTIDIATPTQIDCAYDNMIISLIVINNITAGYSIIVRRLETEIDLETLLYKFQLDNGDSIRDTTQYKMSKGDYIELESSASENTTYYISAEVS